MPDVLFQNSNTPIESAGGDTLSGLQTVNAGVNLGAVIYVVWDDANEGITILTCKYNGVLATAMGARVQIGTVNNRYLQAFTLPNPASGSHTLEIIFSGINANLEAAVLLAYINVDQTTPMRVGSYNSFSGLTAADGTKAIAITSQTGDRSVTAIGELDSTPSSDKTLEIATSTGGSIFYGADDAVGATTVTHTWDTGIASANAIAMIGGSLAAAAAADKTPYVPYQQQQPILAQ